VFDFRNSYVARGYPQIRLAGGSDMDEDDNPYCSDLDIVASHRPLDISSGGVKVQATFFVATIGQKHRILTYDYATKSITK
jgi:hypothetical protein